MKKIYFSAVLLSLSCTAFCSAAFKDWAGDAVVRKHPGTLTVTADSAKLKGLPRGDWAYFCKVGKKAEYGQSVVISFTASGKGKIKLFLREFNEKKRFCHQTQKVLDLSSTPKKFNFTFPLKSRNTVRILPRFIIAPGTEIDFKGPVTYNVTGKVLPKLFARAIADRKDFLYKVGDKARFTMRITLDGKDAKNGIAEIRILKNGQWNRNYTTYDLAKGPAAFDVTMDKPGFFIINMNLKLDGKYLVKNMQVGAGGFDAEKIRTGSPVPADLITYWQAQYAKLNKEVPPAVKVTRRVSTRTHNITYYSCDNFGGTKTYFTIAIPKNKKGRLPMMFTVPPAGNYGYGAFTYPDWIRVTIPVFDRLFPSQNDYEKFNRPLRYYLKGTTSREQYYFYKSILGMMRVMDHAMANVKEWDGKHLSAVGRSQGGGSAIILAALNPKIQCVSADVPALCDHNSGKAGRRAGWPQILDYKVAKKFGDHARYFDAANFAAFVKCPAVVSVGFYDTMCVPTSIYAAYNNLKGPKKIYNYPRYGHGWGERDERAWNNATKELLKEALAK